jgi:hypothetical protein
MLKSTFTALDVWLPMWKSTCTFDEAMKIDLKDGKFETYCELYSVINEKKHTTLADAEALIECYKRSKQGGIHIKYAKESRSKVLNIEEKLKSTEEELKNIKSNMYELSNSKLHQKGHLSNYSKSKLEEHFQRWDLSLTK